MDGNFSAQGLDIDRFEQGIKKMFLGGIFHAVTTKTLCLDDSEIRSVEALHDRLGVFLDEQFDYMIRNARLRARNQRLLAGYDYKVVSLGTDCLSRTIPTRWGLKPPKALGERTHPFDLAVHPYDALCQVLDDDFASYLDTTQLTVAGRNYVVHKCLKIQFNHEIGEQFSESNFAYFVELYTRRVAQFRQDVAKNPVLFILHMRTNRTPSRLYDILHERLPRDDWHLLTINTSQNPCDVAAVETLPDRITLRHVPFPYPDYVWHLAQHFSTPGGQEFERRIVSVVREAIVGNFRVRA